MTKHHYKTINSILDRFSKTTNVTFKILNKEKVLKVEGIDPLVSLSYGGASFKFALEYKSLLDAKSLEAIIYYLKQLPEEGILCARYINKKIASQLKEQNVPFIDLAGNAYINKPPILIDIQGKRIKESATKETSVMFATAGLKIIFIFLCDEKYINSTYREISELSGVSLGMVSRVMKSMQQQGFLTEKNKKTNILLDKPRLLEQWVIYYQNKLRPKLIHRRYTTSDLEWKDNIKLKENSYWGGEVAAEKLTNYLRPATGTIYTFDNPNTLSVVNKLKESQNGEIEILKAFWSKNLIKENKKIVPSVLIYADLLAQRNSRSHEAAQIIFEKELSEPLK